MSDRTGRCHDCTAPRTEVNMLSRHILELQKDKGELTDKVRELKAQVEKMKRDVMSNVKWADQNKNEQMYCKLNAMINQWEIK